MAALAAAFSASGGLAHPPRNATRARTNVNAKTDLKNLIPIPSFKDLLGIVKRPQDIPFVLFVKAFSGRRRVIDPGEDQ